MLSPAPTLLDSLADLSTREAARQARTMRTAELGRALLQEQAGARDAAQEAARAAGVAALAASAAAAAAEVSAKAAGVLDRPIAARAVEPGLDAAQSAADTASLRAAEAALAARGADAAAHAAVNAVTALAPDPCARHRRATPF